MIPTVPGSAGSEPKWSRPTFVAAALRLRILPAWGAAGLALMLGLGATTAAQTPAERGQAVQRGPQATPICIAATDPADRLGEVVFVNESDYLSDEELAAIEARFVGCSLAALDPAAVAEAVNAAYAAYPAPLAFARPLAVGPGSVTVELVEIRYGRVSVRGNDSTLSSYVIGRSGAQAGDLADVALLQERLAAVPETADIRIEADLEPGEALNTSELILTVQEPPRVSAALEVDNWGVPETGREQVGVTGTFRSLTGHRDNLSLALSASEGARSGFGFYRLPLGYRGTRWSVSAAYDWSERVGGDPILRGLRSDTLALATRLSHPFRAGDFGNDILNASIGRFRDRSSLDGFEFLDQVTHEFGIGSSHVRRQAGRYSAILTHELVYGTTEDQVVGDRFDYLRWAGSADAALRIAGPFTASIQGGWQVSSDPVASAVRFATTGPTLVRGYPATSGGGASGYYFRGRLSALQTFSGQGWPADLRLTPYVFSDLGEAFSYDGGDLAGSGLAQSVGFGTDFAILSRQIGDRRYSFGGTAFVAFPLRDVDLFDADEPFAGLQMSVTF